MVPLKNAFARARIYCRFSPRPRPDETETLAFQEDECRRWCKREKIEVACVYSDPDISGRKDCEEDRPELWKLLNEIQRGELIVAWKWDRISRSVYLTEYLTRESRKHGYSIATVTRGVDGTSPEDDLVRTVMAAADEYFAKVNAIRTKHAMRRYQRIGVAMSANPPYGMMRGPDGVKVKNGKEVPQRRWVECPREMEVVRRILALHGEGLSNHAIAKRLNDEKAPCRGGEWAKIKIKRIVERAKQEA